MNLLDEYISSPWFCLDYDVMTLAPEQPLGSDDTNDTCAYTIPPENAGKDLETNNGTVEPLPKKVKTTLLPLIVESC